MNDYWNDPPEPVEVPMCCDEPMSVDDAGNCRCASCGREIKAESGFLEPTTTWTDDCDIMVNFPAKCPHGNEWFECNACMVASDIAYDTQRENSMR